MENKIEKILDDGNAPIFEIVKRAKLRELLDTKAAMFTKPWYGQLMNYPQILAYMYMINEWLKIYAANIV